MIEINSKDLKIIIPVIAAFLIILTITVIYPTYSDIWNLLFWIGIFYLSIKSLSNSDNQIQSLKQIHISVKIAFVLAIIIGLVEVFVGKSLVFSTALLVLAIILDIIFEKKES